MSDEIDYMSMSAADFAKEARPEYTASTDTVETTDEPETPVVDSAEEMEDDTTQATESNENLSEDDSDDDEDTTDEPTTTEGEEKTTTEKSDEDSTEATEDVGDLKRILAPFKANGVEVQVNSVDEAIKLMQMGANYNKKMTALKPSLKVLKMLEGHGLLDESKLSHLIDLEKGNPEAIAKLIKDRKLDAIELSQDDKEYVPSNYSVSDEAVELDETIKSIQDSPHGANTLDIVGNKWDRTSRELLAQNPAALLAINEQVGNGTYARVNQEVERQKMLGGLKGMSDLQAYDTVGKQLLAAGKLNVVQPVQAKQPAPVTDTTTKPQTRDTAKKKAAASPQSSPKVTTKLIGINPLEMSAEDFAKTTPEMFV